MASLKDIRRRIQAVRGTQKVTRAMKLVAAAKLKRTQQTALDSRTWSTGMYKTAMMVSRRLGVRAPVFWRRPEKIECVDLVVITSDRGLCGGFNEMLLRTVDEGIADAEDHCIAAKLFVVGKKGARHCALKRYDAELPPAGVPDADTVHWLAGRLMERLRAGESAGCNVAFNRFASAARYEPTFWNLLPLHKRGGQTERNMEYLYEPERPGALDTLCEGTLRGSLFQAMLESRAAEIAARMSAMDNATKNADEMIAHLTSVYNRARQESITKELLDIVGGAEALR